MTKSMPRLRQARVSLEQIATIYRVAHHEAPEEALDGISDTILKHVPNSKGMAFLDFLGLCEKIFDVYEE